MFSIYWDNAVQRDPLKHFTMDAFLQFKLKHLILNQNHFLDNLDNGFSLQYIFLCEVCKVTTRTKAILFLSTTAFFEFSFEGGNMSWVRCINKSLSIFHPLRT